MIVLDTAALLYWTLDPSRLSPDARLAIEQSERIAVSSISIWEIGLKVKQGKLEIPLTVAEYTKRLQQVQRLDILPVDVQTWLENLDLPWEHRDPADRTIVALAARLACPLVTSDHTMIDYYENAVW